ncbi:MAG: ISKra4 family transposase [Cyanobacteria bacterium P01_A01_bin.37]
MNLSTIITAQMQQLHQQMEKTESIEAAVEIFEDRWKALGREILESQLQQKIEQVEASHDGAHQRRARHYQSPLGRLTLKRRAYWQDGHWQCWADTVLGLPDDGWFRSVKELSSALGVSTDFAHATQLLERWSGVRVSERSVANHVESYGNQLIETEAQHPAHAVCPVLSSVIDAACPTASEPPILYIGADGIHTPLKHGKTQEAKVGVLFWQHEHRQLSSSRRDIRERDYVATLDSVESFREQLNQRYGHWVNQQHHQVVCLGDGAPWIWLMAELLWPGCIQVLDFFHLSEYVWSVARLAWPEDEANQQLWVETQQMQLKQSHWQAVITETQRLPPGSDALQTAIEALQRYILNNQSRIDYHAYLERGLMIGSGVVESSNRRIVTQRLKQSGMFWSYQGAQAIMALRACYLSNSSRWNDFWYPTPGHD